MQDQLYCDDTMYENYFGIINSLLPVHIWIFLWLFVCLYKESVCSLLRWRWARIQRNKPLHLKRCKHSSDSSVANAGGLVPKHLVPWWLLTKMLFCLFDAELHLICICLSYEYLHMGDCFTSGYVLMRKSESKVLH